jgi:hypothetical protein
VGMQVEGQSAGENSVKFKGSGIKVQVQVQGSGFKVEGSGFRVKGSGLKVEGCRWKVNPQVGRELASQSWRLLAPALRAGRAAHQSN